MTLAQIRSRILALPYVNHIETDSDEVCEGECTLWADDGCTLLIDFDDSLPDEAHLSHTLAQVGKYFDELNRLQAQTAALLAQELNSEIDSSSLYPQWICFAAEQDGSLHCSFAVGINQAGFDEACAEFDFVLPNQIELADFSR